MKTHLKVKLWLKERRMNKLEREIKRLEARRKPLLRRLGFDEDPPK